MTRITLRGFEPSVVKILKSTRKRMNRLQYSVCKCEVESTGKWSTINVLLNQPHSNLVPRVLGLNMHQRCLSKKEEMKYVKRD